MNDKEEARGLIIKYGSLPNVLAKELIRISLVKLNVVFYVFELLGDFNRLDVGCQYLANIPIAGLKKLATTSEGLAFCKLLTYWLGNSTVVVKPLSCSSLFADLTNLRGIINNAERSPNNTAQPKKISDAEIAKYRLEAKKKKQTFNEDIIWELPDGGTGFVTYNRNDVKIDGLDQIGTKETIEAIIRLAQEWSVNPDNKDGRKLQIGDISRAGGLDTSEHKGHEDGKIVDIRLLRKDSATGKGANLNYNNPSYDQDLTKMFIKMVKKLYPSIFIRFNDGDIAGKGEFTYVHKDTRGTTHDDHLHLEFR